MADISNYLLSDKFFQQIIDTLPVLLFWTDANHIILGNNLPHAQAFGYKSANELIGMPISEWGKRIKLSDSLVKRVGQEHEEIIQTKKGKKLEYTAVLADGKEHTHLSHKEPLLDKNNEVIDWDACLQREAVCGNKNVLYQLLSILADEFKTTKKVLKKAYKKKDDQSLRDELHKCRGGLTYLNLPELESAMKAFHDAIRAKPPEYERLEKTYKSAIDAINHFQKAYVKYSK